jgi:low affinity Fe/Cu permease
MVIVWVLAGVFLSACGTAVGWAMSTNTSITELKGTQNVLQDQINAKLDILLKKKEQQEGGTLSVRRKR